MNTMLIAWPNGHAITTALLIDVLACLAVGTLTFCGLRRKRGPFYSAFSCVHFALDGLQEKLEWIGGRIRRFRIRPRSPEELARESAVEAATELHTLHNMTAIHQGMGDRRSEAAGYALMGMKLSESRMYGEALRECQKALTIFREIGEGELECAVIDTIAGIYYSSKAFEKTLEYANMELELARKIGSREHEATALTVAGGAQYSLGKYSTAIKLHLQALAIARAEHEHALEALILYNTSLAQYAMGNRKQGLANARTAFEIFETIGDGRSAEVRGRLDE